MDIILEIVKYTLPSLIMFATLYYMMRHFFANQLAMKSMDFKQEQLGKTLPLRLQAYERLMLFSERISVDNLSLRLSSSDMDAQSLGNAMMVAIQQEYDHNLAQQIYVSSKLWDIVTLGKDHMQTIISDSMKQLPSNASAHDLMEAIIQKGGGLKVITTLRSAIQEEVEIIL